MYNNNLNFKDFLSANKGNKEAKCKIIERYERYISKVSRKNTDMKNTIILSVYELFDDLEEKFEKYFNSIN